MTRKSYGFTIHVMRSGTKMGNCYAKGFQFQAIVFVNNGLKVREIVTSTAHSLLWAGLYLARRPAFLPGLVGVKKPPNWVPRADR